MGAFAADVSEDNQCGLFRLRARNDLEKVIADSHRTLVDALDGRERRPSVALHSSTGSAHPNLEHRISTSLVGKLAVTPSHRFYAAQERSPP